MKTVLILQYFLQTIFVFWHYSFYITTQYGYSLESNISDEMLGNIPKLDVISREWNVYTYFIRIFRMLVISKGFSTKSWSAKVNIFFHFWNKVYEKNTPFNLFSFRFSESFIFMIRYLVASFIPWNFQRIVS